MALLSVLPASLASTATAQQTDSVAVETLLPGARALSFRLPEGGTSEFGIWRMRSPRRLDGVFVRLNVAHSDDDSGGESTAIGVGVGPAARRYLQVAQRVAAFWQTDVSLDYGHTRHSSTVARGRQKSSAHLLGAALGGGIGLEWFPARQVGISGHTGFRLSGGYHRGSAEALGRTDEREGWSAQGGTFTSSLLLSIYLPRRGGSGPANPLVANVQEPTKK